MKDTPEHFVQEDIADTDIQAFLEEAWSDMEDLCLAEKRYEDMKASGTEGIPLEEVIKRYGLDIPED